ncbi:MAG: glutaredoxin 3 [Cocleimonas sp.]
MPEESVKIVMYATRFCPYCMRARRLLKNKGVEFEEIRVSGGNGLWEEMEQKSGGNTVPQIFINDEPVGGYDDIAALDRAGELDKKLGL